MNRRVAVITGGEGGLGRALAERLRGADYDVLAPGHGQLDVVSEQSVRAFFDALDRVDLLVNNAGVLGDDLAFRLKESTWDRVLQTNLRGAFLCARAAARPMLKRRAGHIVQIGSLSARTGPAGQAAYASAKAGLVGLTHSLARELGPRNVRVNCILPGYLRTPMTASARPDLLEEVRGRHVLGRLNTPEMVGEFLVCLDRMEHTSGQIFQLDSRIAPWV